MNDAKDFDLVPPPNDEIRTLGEAILQRIPWKRSCIVVNHTSLGPPKRVAQSSSPPIVPQPPQDSTKSSSLSAPLLHPKQAEGQTKSDSILPAVRAPVGKNSERSRTAGVPKMSKKPAASSQKLQEPTISTHKAADALSLKKKQPGICSQKAAHASSPQKPAADSLKKQQPSNGSQKAAISSQRAAATAASLKKQQPTKGSQKEPTRGGGTAWTKPNPLLKYGQSILTRAELERSGSATTALHDYYLKMCKARGKK